MLCGGVCILYSKKYMNYCTYVYVNYVKSTVVFGSFHLRTSCCVCSVKPDDRPRIAAPVVAIAIEEPYQLADSLADNPVRIKFEVNQVRLSCYMYKLHVCNLF